MTGQEEYSNVEVENDHNDDPPALYSKTLILLFSIFFSTIFAAFLLMSNLRTIGKNRIRLVVLAFAIVYTIATGLLLQVLNLQPSYTLISNVIGAAILNEFFWNRYIGNDREFVKKSWIKPTLLSLLVVLILFFLFLGNVAG